MTAFPKGRALRFVAPAGAPISPSVLATWLAAWVLRGDHRATLEGSIAAAVGVRGCWVVSTGRAGMTVLLRALRTLSNPTRDEVIIPSYTCYSVAASVVKAGLAPRVADVDPTTLDFDHERLQTTDFRRVLAVVATNLYGLPNDLPRLTTMAHERGAFVVDDAAQALGARMAGNWCGTSGDVGLYSFDKGKNVSAIDGGAIVTNDSRIMDAVSEEMRTIPVPSVGETAFALTKLAAYALLLHPRGYWIPNGVPMLGLGRTVYATDYAITQHPRALSALAVAALPTLKEYTARRRRNAEAMLARLRGEPRVRTIAPLSGAKSAYLRLPLLLDGRELRDRAVHALNRAGIGATASYPASIADIPELNGQVRGSDRDAIGGRSVAERILTLPTHPYVTPGDADRAIDVLLHAVRSAGCVDVPMRPAALKVPAR